MTVVVVGKDDHTHPVPSRGGIEATSCDVWSIPFQTPICACHLNTHDDGLPRPFDNVTCTCQSTADGNVLPCWLFPFTMCYFEAFRKF